LPQLLLCRAAQGKRDAPGIIAAALSCAAAGETPFLPRASMRA